MGEGGPCRGTKIETLQNPRHRSSEDKEVWFGPEDGDYSYPGQGKRGLKGKSTSSMTDDSPHPNKVLEFVKYGSRKVIKGTTVGSG